MIRDYGYIAQILVDNDWKCGQLGSADGILVSPANDFGNGITAVIHWQW